MAKKKPVESYLNKKTKMSDTKVDAIKVQAEDLQQAVVKIPCTNYESATPFSVLANDFADLSNKTSAVPFVVNAVEMAKQEVKLPVAEKKVAEENVVKKDAKKEASKEVAKQEKSAKLPNIPPQEQVAKPRELSEIEILNKMKELQKDMPQEVAPKENVNIPANAKEYEKYEETKVDKAAVDLKALNELQAEQAKVDKKKVENRLEVSTNELDDLLRELEEQDDTLGMG